MPPTSPAPFPPVFGRDEALELANLAQTWAATTLVGLYLVRDGRFAWANEQFARDTRLGMRELLGRPSLDLVHPEDRDGVRAHAVAMLQGRRTTPYEYRYVTASGEARWALETVAGVTVRGERAVLGNFLDITARKELEAQLAHRAFHDELTGLANRALLLDRLERALGRRDRGDGEVAALYLDLDDFKAVNDARGHHAGDILLQQVAERLRQATRQADTTARLGGDEFVVVLEGAGADADALRLADRIAGALAAPFIVAGHRVAVTASCGVAVQGAGPGTAQALLRRADVALYAAKARGKACAALADPAPA